MKNKLFCILSVFFLLFSGTLSASLQDEKVVTLHGILGAPWNMYYLGLPFQKNDIEVIHWGYPSRDKKIEQHAEDLVNDLKKIAKENPGQSIHFITHSMGGLILRAALNHPEAPAEAKWGRAVLLAPPNRGAVWGRFIEQFAIARKIAKSEAGLQLLTEEDFNHLGDFPETMEIMVIAGNASANPFIMGENDGTVSVDETYLDTPHKHVVIRAGHKSIIASPTASQLTYQFITTGE